MNYYDKPLENAREVLKMAAEISMSYYNKPLVITYSGGKDSDVLLRIAIECLKPSEFEVINSHTTVDAPNTVYHIREVVKELNDKGIKAEILKPETTMWDLIVKNGMPPTRLARYCCPVLKEQTIPNRVIATGVRASESNGRKGRDVFSLRGKTKKDAKFYSLEHTKSVFQDNIDVSAELNQDIKIENAYDCTLVANAKQNNDIIVNPIYEWTDNMIWAFINDRNIKVCDLYAMGYERVGCIGCPNATYRWKKKQFADFPGYKKAYIKAFDRMLELRRQKGLETNEAWTTGEEVFNWWTEEYKHNCKGQMNIDEFIKKE